MPAGEVDDESVPYFSLAMLPGQRGGTRYGSVAVGVSAPATPIG